MYNEKIYLDNNSTTPLDPRVLEAMLVDLKGPPANPSSVHSFGARAKQLLQTARQSIALFFGVAADEVIFTSGGTESINLMLRGLPKGHLITSDIEHSSVYKTTQLLESQGVTVTRIRPGIQGAPTKEGLEEAIRPNTTAIILSAANHETGVIANIGELARVAEKWGIPLLVDGVSYIGKEPLPTPLASGIAAFACSGHKFHAPKGIGVLILRKTMRLTPIATGGNQEYAHRAGTENLAGILGLAEAIAILHESQAQISKHLIDLRNHFESELFSALPDLCINGLGPRLSNTANIAFLGCDGETLLMQLDLMGVAASLGSACSSGALEPSRILTNMGIDKKRASSSIRFSLGRFNTLAEIDGAIERIVPLVQKMRTFY